VKVTAVQITQKPGSTGGSEALAEALVDGLAARAAALNAPALAASVEEIRSRGAAGRTPVGMYRLAEVLNSAPPAPAPRQPVGDPAAAIECVRRYPTTVLDATRPDAIAGIVGGLVRDGLRVLVTGSDADELAAVRAALPTEAAGLCLEGPEPLSATELRELRALLATSTRARTDRLRQLLPDPAIVPDPELVERLCVAAGRPGLPPTTSAELVPELLGEMPPERLDALIETARRCDIAVSQLNRDGQAPWSWDLLEGLLFGQSWTAFDRLVALCTETLELAEGLRDAGDQLAVVGTIEPEDLAHLRRYADFLDAGGRPRSYFRSPEQKSAEPVLRQLRLDAVPLKDAKLLRQALSFVQLIADIERIAAECGVLDLPVPSDIPAVAKLLARLQVAGDAARAVEVLRHEVLFIHPSSPVSMPDMEATEAVARAIINAGSSAEMVGARRQLAELADKFAASLPDRLYADTLRVDTSFSDFAEFDDPRDEPTDVPAPEYLAAIKALREHRLPEYLDALRGLAAARRDRAQQLRLQELLDRLRAAAPGLAEAWQRTGGRTFAPGTVRFQPIDEVLAAMPEADRLDVVLLLGADDLDPGYLVVAAAAPRLLVASSGTGDGAGGADEGTVASMLRGAGVPVIAALERPAPPNGTPPGGQPLPEGAVPAPTSGEAVDAAAAASESPVSGQPSDPSGEAADPAA
jgi:hypothetical protein